MASKARSGERADATADGYEIANGKGTAGTNGKVTATNGKALVANGKALVANGKALPAKGKAVTANGKAVTVNGKTVAITGQTASTNGNGTRGNGLGTKRAPSSKHAFATKQALATKQAKSSAEPAYSAPEIHQVPADAPERPSPRWLHFARIWHEAGRQPAPVILDTAIASGVIYGTTASGIATIIGASTFFAGGFVYGLWQRRGTLETQGVAWYLRKLLPTAVTAAVAINLYFYKISSVGNRPATAFLALLGALIGVRTVLWQIISRARRHHYGLKATLVVGPTRDVAKVRHRMYVFPEAGLRFAVGYQHGVDEDTKRVSDLVRANRIEHVLLIGESFAQDMLEDFVAFTDIGTEMSVLLPLARLGGHTGAHLGDLGMIPLRMKPSWGSQAAKRVIDVVASAVLLVLASPLLAVVAIAIRRDSPGPAIFKQRRVGVGGKPFTVYKFRSMVSGAENMPAPHLASDEHAELLASIGSDPSQTTFAEIISRTPIESLSHLYNAMREGDPRVTRVGGFIRKTALDELPQLVNVLKGEMSLVGPRPIAVTPERFNTIDHIRHRVQPGLTGPWQVHGSSALPYRDMVDLDLNYVATRSLGTDLKLLSRTLPALLVRRAPA